MNDDLPIGMMDQPPHVVAAFRRMVAEGQSPRLAEMLAVRKGPCLSTDVTFTEGLTLDRIAKQAGQPYVEKIMKQAKAAGITVNGNSFYNGTIADERQGGDPGAWLLAGDGKDKFKKTLRDRGKSSQDLGVEHDESQERTDHTLSRLEKQRKIKKDRLTAKNQIMKDAATGTLPKEMRQKVIHKA